MREPLLKFFPDALLNRLVVVPFYPLSKEMLDRIIKLNLGRVKQRLAENHQVPLTYDQSVVDLITQRCNRARAGRPHGRGPHHANHAAGNQPRNPPPLHRRPAGGQG